MKVKLGKGFTISRDLIKSENLSNIVTNQFIVLASEIAEEVSLLSFEGDKDIKLSVIIDISI